MYYVHSGNRFLKTTRAKHGPSIEKLHGKKKKSVYTYINYRCVRRSVPCAVIVVVVTVVGHSQNEYNNITQDIIYHILYWIVKRVHTSTIGFLDPKHLDIL